jgi:hypothetical protein
MPAYLAFAWNFIVLDSNTHDTAILGDFRSEEVTEEEGTPLQRLGWLRTLLGYSDDRGDAYHDWQ